ncbi:Uncharacterised protein [Vibrio cholerae]|nr:Uncharacterised protein [Vibrio cholerae]
MTSVARSVSNWLSLGQRHYGCAIAASNSDWLRGSHRFW